MANRRQEAARARLQKRTGLVGAGDAALIGETLDRLVRDAAAPITDEEVLVVVAAEVAQMRADKRGTVRAGIPR